jgi:iron complex transport system substrate-binding protein
MAEWIDPPYNSGHWLPEMVDYAGGENLLSNPGEYSTPTTWDTVLAEEPEIVVIAACGFDLNEAAAHAAELRLPVRTVVVDGGTHYSGPAPRLADGVQQLGYLLHPGAAPDPGHPHVELSFAGRHGG